MAPGRRRLLTAMGATGVAAIAGCTGRGSGADTTDETATLLPDEGDSADMFGESVALSADGNIALVGADQGHPSDEEPGVASVFERADGEWRERATLTDENGESGDNFGSSVALSADGTTALVGADKDTLANGTVAGSASVFEHGDGWTRRATFTPDDGESESESGVSVPVSLSADGRTALLGTPAEADPNGEDAGAASVYRRRDDGWAQTANVLPEDGAPHDEFGAAVSLSADGTTAVVAAPEAGPNDNPGAVSVFDAEGGEWRHRGRLRPTVDQDEQGFAASVAVSGDGTTVLVGAWTAGESLDTFGSGWVYVFERGDDGWETTDWLVPSDGDAGSDTDWFGNALAIDDAGGTAVVGAPNDHALGGGAGSAYVFEREEDWTERAKLAASDGEGTDEFGYSVAMAGDGSTVLIGAHDDDNANGAQAGAAYVFEDW